MKRVLALLFALILVAPASGQQLPMAEVEPPVPLTGVERFRADIPTPQQVIGHQVGSRHTEPHQVVDYFRAVAEVSDRVSVKRHGRTYENRPLIHAIITAPSHHQRLDDIRAANRQLSEAPDEVDDASLEDMPLVSYQGCTIHGDEASGVEAAMLTLYYLAAGEGSRIEQALNNTVLVLDPVLNPDGHHRFTTWVNQNRGETPVAAAEDREHEQPWPTGRVNHYWFDPNRDWMPLQHPAAQARAKLLNRWRPQVITDFHEMGRGETYFYQPGVRERVNPLIPQANQKLTGRIAKRHSAQLDRIGQLSFSREQYDDFYLGKGSTYSDMIGAIGILYEQASSRALKHETDRGVLTYPRTVRNQTATSLSTIEALIELRQPLLEYQRWFFRTADEFAQQQRETAYVVARENGRTRAQLLAKLLDRHRIRTHELAKPVEVDGNRYSPGEAYIIPLDQPQARLVQSLFERRTEFKDDVFYDVSAWSLPLMYGLEHAMLEKDPVAWVGERREPTGPTGGQLIGGRPNVAYVLKRNRYFAPRALHRLQAIGAQTNVLTKPIDVEIGGQTYKAGRGSIVVPVRGRRAGPDADTIRETIETAVDQDHVQVLAVDSAITPQGPDLGSDNYALPIEPVKIALVTGRGTSAYNAGEVWHLLSERFDTPVALLDADNIDRETLEPYNRLILAGGWYGPLDHEVVAQWVEQGGTLIGLTSALEWLNDQNVVDLERKSFKMNKHLADVAYENLEEARERHEINGSIFEARLDNTHPIAFGYGNTTPLFRTRDNFYKPPETPGATVGRYTSSPLMSGYMSEARGKNAAGSAAIVALEKGRGRVVLFADNPNFRAFAHGTNGLFLNAIYFSGIIE